MLRFMPVFACGYDVAVFPYGFVLATRTNRLAKTKFVAAPAAANEDWRRWESNLPPTPYPIRTYSTVLPKRRKVKTLARPLPGLRCPPTSAT